MKLIVGLGNPGKGYAHNRHNVGFLCLDRIAKNRSIDVGKSQCQSRVGSGQMDGLAVILSKPQTYMNLSGESVRCLIKRYHLSEKDLVVIHDDLDLPLGKVRLRARGSAGGHRGVQSIIDALGTQEFPRIKVGIGRPGEAGHRDVVDYVLGDFSRDEEREIEPIFDRVAEAVSSIIVDGIELAMNRFN